MVVPDPQLFKKNMQGQEAVILKPQPIYFGTVIKRKEIC